MFLALGRVWHSCSVAYCGCCRGKNVYFGPVKAPDGLPSTASLCGICSRHWGDDPARTKRREQDHFEQWQHDMDALEQQHRSELRAQTEQIAGLRAEIRTLEQTLDERPVRIVRENLDQETVDQAHEERAKAQFARDRAYRTIAELRGMHHDTGRGTCKCGTHISKCDIIRLIDNDQPFLRWEARQVALLRQNGRASAELPQNHPARINPRWSPSGAK